MARYQPTHKAQTRRRLVESAVTAFRRDGLEATGLKEIMSDLGLTVGGFYRHFESKSALVREAVEQGVLQSRERMRALSDEGGADWIERFAAGYLSDAHRRSTAQGCVLAALASDIARSDPDIKAACETGLREIQEEVLQHTPPGRQEVADQIWGLIALELGGLLLSRMVESEATAAEILSSCRRALRKLLESSPADERTPSENAG
jgi:TetR/AcrR family transcriptional regulator, transcriptional repressor for nem operon